MDVPAAGLRRTVAGRGALLAVTVTLFAGGRADAAQQLVVDRDGAQCPQATYQSISAAVAAAQPGDTVLVCPDLYEENVAVTKTLTIKARGGGNGDLRRACSDPGATADPSKDAIVSATVPFSLRADDVVLDGFVVRDSLIGISSSQLFSGYRIEDNLAEDNGAFGVRFRSNGVKPSVLARNCTRRNGGAGAFVTAGSDLHVTDNASFQDPSFALVFPPTHDIDISHNTVLASQDPDAAAIAVGATTGGTITHNRIAGGLGNGIGFAGPDQGVAPNLGVEVADNEMTDMAASGIRATAGSLFDSTIEHNRSVSNGRDGIRIEAGQSSGNVIGHNELRSNAEHDCHDDTVGPGTAATANLWVLNVAWTENRPGLCPRGRG